MTLESKIVGIPPNALARADRVIRMIEQSKIENSMAVLPNVLARANRVIR